MGTELSDIWRGIIPPRQKYLDSYQRNYTVLLYVPRAFLEQPQFDHAKMLAVCISSHIQCLTLDANESSIQVVSVPVDLFTE